MQRKKKKKKSKLQSAAGLYGHVCALMSFEEHAWQIGPKEGQMTHGCSAICSNMASIRLDILYVLNTYIEHQIQPDKHKAQRNTKTFS